jgi:hypothetical protein
MQDRSEINKKIGKIAVFAIFAVAILYGQSALAGSSSSSSSGGSSSQSTYNNYVSQNACGCYNTQVVSMAQSGQNVTSQMANSPNGSYGGSSQGGGGTLFYNNGVVTNVAAAGNQYVGTAYYNGSPMSVVFTGSGNGVDYWQPSSSSSGSGGSSGSGSSSSGGGSSSSGSSSGGSSSSSSSSSSSGGGYGTAHYEETCTSSGKGGQTCTGRWVVDSTPNGFCTTASCSSSSSSSGGNNTSVPLPTNLSIDASPRLVKNGNSSIISWSSQNASSCSVTGPHSFSASGTSGSQVASNILEASTYTLTCQFASGSQQSSVTVNLIPTWREY